MNDRARNRSEGPPGRSGRLHRLRAEALAFEHPDASLAGAFDAARERAIAPVRDEQGAAPPTRVLAFEQAALSAFAALVIGDHDLARTRIAAIAGERAGLLTAWLIGRYYGYTGDPQAASWLRPAADALALADTIGIGTGGQAHHDPLLPVVARELIAIAETTGDPDLATMVRRLAGGANPATPVDTVLERLANVSTSAGDDGPERALNALLGGRTNDGIAGWETLARAGRTRAREWVLPLLAAGILGIDPDAERGRLRLRLHIPAAWPRWGAGSIRMGDAAVDLHIERDDSSITISVDQVRGALPITLILEPTVHAPVEACLVDGQAADLALRSFPDRVIVPVQLVLDAPRELRISLGGGE